MDCNKNVTLLAQGQGQSLQILLTDVLSNFAIILQTLKKI